MSYTTKHLDLKPRTKLRETMNVYIALDNLRGAMAKTYFVKKDEDDDLLITGRRNLLNRFTKLLRLQEVIGPEDEVLGVNLMSNEFEVFRREDNYIIWLTFKLL